MKNLINKIKKAIINPTIQIIIVIISMIITLINPNFILIHIVISTIFIIIGCAQILYTYISIETKLKQINQLLSKNQQRKG